MCASMTHLPAYRGRGCFGDLHSEQTILTSRDGAGFSTNGLLESVEFLDEAFHYQPTIRPKMLHEVDHREEPAFALCFTPTLRGPHSTRNHGETGEFNDAAFTGDFDLKPVSAPFGPTGLGRCDLPAAAAQQDTTVIFTSGKAPY